MKKNLCTYLPALLIFAVICAGTGAKAQSNFSRKQFYAAMQGKDAKMIEGQLELLKDSKVEGKRAYEGALMAKRAGLLKKPHDKLKSFKSGATSLQNAIGADQDNTEYRFLRLMIQEHAPKIVNYDGDLEKDSRFIKEHFDSLTPELKEIVKNYSKSSKILKSDDLN